MPYDKNDDWARKSKMKTAGMFSTPSYWGVGEPFNDSLSGAPSGLACCRRAVGSRQHARAQAAIHERRGCRW